jgi:hypothetical protein
LPVKRILAGTILVLLAGTGWAHDGEHDGHPHSHWWLDLDNRLDLSWYVGAGVGQSRFDDYALGNDGSFTSQDKDGSDATLRVFGGMGLGKYVALELGYVDFGEATSRAQSDGSSTLWNAGPQSVKVGVDGYHVSLVGRLPLTDVWGLFAKVGQARLEGTASASLDTQCCGVVAGTFSDDTEEAMYGGGVQYDGLRPARISVEYGVLPSEVGIASDATLDWFAISVIYLF